MRTFVAILAVAAAGLSPVRADEAKAADKIKVLIIDGQNNHNWRATTPLVKKVLEDSGRFAVTVATAPARPVMPKEPKPAKDAKPVKPAKPGEADEAKLKEARVKYAADFAAYTAEMEKFAPRLEDFAVVLSNYNGGAWPAALRKSLEDNLRAGRIGLVIFHAANNSFPDWTEFNRMIGMGWRGNSAGERLYVDDAGKEVRMPKGQGPGAGEARIHAFAVTMRDAEHPITKGLPREWMHAPDQLCHCLRGPAENVKLLATAYSDKAKGGTGVHEPMIWTVAYGQGRVFHTPMGHDAVSLRCVGLATVMLRGVEWAATGKVTIAALPNFPPADKVSSLPAN